MTTSKCSICDNDIGTLVTDTGEVFWTKGHNAEPVNDGRCCDSCNWHTVIPARIAELRSERTA